jgi:Uma2 family endonuclease
MSLDVPTLAGSMDVDEFMAFIEPRPHTERWDLIEGVAVRMAPLTYADLRVVLDLCALLNRAFDSKGLDLFAYHHVAIRIPGLRNFQAQPDVSVVPGIATSDLYSGRFHLVAEILSPTNTRSEIEFKLRPLLGGTRESLCGRDRAARVSGGHLREARRLGTGKAHERRRSDRNA